MTIPRLRADLRNVFEYGQMYTALSRAQGLDGLSLIAPVKLTSESKLVHPKVSEFYWGGEAKAEKGRGGERENDENDKRGGNGARANGARATATRV